MLVAWLTQRGLRPQPTGVRHQESGFKEGEHLDRSFTVWIKV
jgi:hypothetical protein